VLAFLRAHIKATQYIYEPAHRDEVIAILAKHTKATPQIAAATYDLYIKHGVIPRGAALFEDGIKANFDALVALGDLATAPPLDRFVDGSFLAEATKPRSQPGPASGRGRSTVAAACQLSWPCRMAPRRSQP